MMGKKIHYVLLNELSSFSVVASENVKCYFACQPCNIQEGIWTHMRRESDSKTTAM